MMSDPAKPATAGDIEPTPGVGGSATSPHKGNRLATEASLYLRQHGQNPLDWYPWGAEALARAKAEDKPIFLSIGYSSCHWCHVMEAETFEKEDVAAYMNEQWICIKVDREERPDLDAVYMEALQGMTGSGGWPMSMFLTPDLAPFYGATYLPGPRFLEVAKKLRQLYDTRRSDLDAQAATLRARLATNATHPDGPELKIEDHQGHLDTLSARFDRRWGGLRGRMKFPTAPRWSYVLHLFRKTGDNEAEAMLRSTLDNMASGGMYDHVGGGFHRYTTEQTWLVPHFEKMLYDNALLAELYTEAAQVFASDGEPQQRYAEVAVDVLDFLLLEMRDPRGGFYASFDADSGGEEGTYYVWTPEEIVKVAGDVDGPDLARILGVTDAGNFEGKSILTRRSDELSLWGLFETHRAALKARRSKRVAPGLDTKVITSWNALTIRAFARGAAVFGHTRYLKAAEKAADFLWDTHRVEAGEGNQLVVASNQGIPGSPAVLDDYALLALAYVELYTVSGALRHLERSIALVERVRESFARKEGGWYHTAREAEAPLGRQFDAYDNAVPCGNGAMAQALVRLAAITDREDLAADLQGYLASQATPLRSHGLEMSWTLDAALLAAGPYREVVLAGEVDKAGSPGAALLSSALSLQAPYAVVIRSGVKGPSKKIQALSPHTIAKHPRDGLPTAYVCQHGTCGRPAHTPGDLLEQVKKDWHY